MKRKIKDISIDTILKLLKANKVLEIIYIDMSDELDHIYKFWKFTTNQFYKEVSKYRYEKLVNESECIIIINDRNLLIKNNYDNRLVIQKLLLKEINVTNIKQTTEKKPLLYNLFNLPA